MAVKHRKRPVSLGPVLLLGVTSLIGIFSFLTLYTTIQAEWLPSFNQSTWVIYPQESENPGIYEKKNPDEASSEIIFIEAQPGSTEEYKVLPTFRMTSTDQYNSYLIPQNLNFGCFGIYKNGVYQEFTFAEKQQTDSSDSQSSCTGFNFANVNLMK